MIDEATVTNILIVVYILLVVAAIFAWVGIYRYYKEDHGEQSPVWKALLILKAIVILGAIATFPIAVAAVLGMPRLPFTGPVVVVYTMIPLITIIVYYLIFRRIRNRKGPDSLR